MFLPSGSCVSPKPVKGPHLLKISLFFRQLKILELLSLKATLSVSFPNFFFFQDLLVWSFCNAYLILSLPCLRTFHELSCDCWPSPNFPVYYLFSKAMSNLLINHVLYSSPELKSLFLDPSTSLSHSLLMFPFLFMTLSFS